MIQVTRSLNFQLDSSSTRHVQLEVVQRTTCHRRGLISVISSSQQGSSRLAERRTKFNLDQDEKC